MSLSARVLVTCAVALVSVEGQNTTLSPLETTFDDVTRIDALPRDDGKYQYLPIVIGVGAGSIVIVVITLAVVCFIRKWSKKRRDLKKHDFNRPHGNTYTPVEFNYGTIDPRLDGLSLSAASSALSLSSSPASSPRGDPQHSTFASQEQDSGDRVRRSRRSRKKFLDTGMENIEEEDDDALSQRVILDNVMYLKSHVDPETASIHSTTSFRNK